MPYAVLLGRALFAAIFLAASPRHFTSEAVAHAAELGVPFAQFAVPLSGALAIAGGLSVLFGYHARIGAACLIAFLVPVTLLMHAFWRLDDAMAIHVQRAMFMKNLSMLGAAVFIACVGAGRCRSVPPPRRDRSRPGARAGRRGVAWRSPVTNGRDGALSR